MSAANNTTAADSIIDISFTTMGAGASFANIISLIILVSDKKLFKKSAFIVAISFGHLLGSLYLLCLGSYRLLYAPLLGNPTHPWQCVKLVFLTFFNLDYQLIGLLMLLVGIERIAGICFPVWYRLHWKSKTSWISTLIVYLCTASIMSWGLYNAYTSRMMTTWRCQQGPVFNLTFTGASAVISSVGGTIGISCTLVALIRGLQQLKKSTATNQEIARAEKQMQLTKTMLSIASFDFLLTVIPNSIVAYNQLTGQQQGISPFYSAIAYSINAEANIFAYLVFNADFRKVATNLVKKILNKCKLILCHVAVGPAPL